MGKRVVVRLESDDAIVFEPRMTGLVLLAVPPTVEHLRLRISLSGGDCDELLFWDRRGLGLVRLVNPDQFDALYGSTTGSRRAHVARRRSAGPAGDQPPRNQGGAARPTGAWPEWAISMPARFCTWPAFIPGGAATNCGRPTGNEFNCDPRSIGSGDPARRFDAGRRHVSQCAQRARRLSEPSSGLRSGRRRLPELPRIADRADRAGPAVDVFLCRLSAAGSQGPLKVGRALGTAGGEASEFALVWP